MTKTDIVKNKKKSKIKVGDKFGRLEVLEDLGAINKNTRFRCRCKCGNIKTIIGCNLRSGHTISCGCLRVETITTHGMARTPSYIIWVAMIQRCTNPDNISYKNYGGRGITVCEEWRNSFEAFFKDMGQKPDGLSIDRIKNELGYFKENCRWATRTEQNRNCRLSKNNKTGVNGVYWNKLRQKYAAGIRANKKYFVGYFTDLEDAKAARIAAEQKYW